MTIGGLCFIVAGIIAFLVGFDVINDGKVDWDYVIAGLVLAGIAFGGWALPLNLVKKVE